MTDVPETPEGVALALLQLILSRDAPPISSKERLLATYGECLRITTSRWSGPPEALH